MKKLFFLAIIYVCALSMNAQPLSGRHTFAQMVETADDQFAVKKDYVEALNWYEKAKEEDPKSIYLDYRVALCHYALRDYAKAEMFLAKVQKKDEKDKDDTNDYSDVPFKLARVKKMQEKYDEAIAILEKLTMTATDPVIKKLAVTELEGARMAKTSTQAELLKVENAGNDVNCPSKDFSPSMSKQGELYYVSDRQNGVVILDGKKTDYFGNIMTATNDGKGVFTNGKALDQVVNREATHTSYVSFSPSGNRMYFTRAEVQGQEVTTSKAFMSLKSGNGWGAPLEIKGINGKVMHPSIGELFGKEVMFFTSDMEGTKGATDIFYATKKTDDTYEYPVNLGDVINTAGEEYTPFYKDGKLYFSSTGHAGFGGFDVFVSSWDGTGWSKPTNVGKGYNSAQDDVCFSTDAKGNALLASNRVGGGKIKGFPATCCEDIWIATMEEFKVSLIANVLDKNKKPLVGTSIQVIEMTDNRPGKTDNKNNATGNNYDNPLAFDKSYMVITMKDGYIPDTTYFNTVGLKKTSVIEKNIVLKARPADPKYMKFVTKEAITQGGAVRMGNIYYDLNDDKILTDAEGDLNALAVIMKEYPSVIIEISSHTDAQGSDKSNQNLSQRRAESAIRYLTEKQGITRERLSPKGYGESVILNRCLNNVKDCTDDEHRFNRRTEFKIIGGVAEKTVERTVVSAKKWSDCSAEEKKSGTPINDDEYMKIVKANTPKK
jgi:peptidoglycan-associated lipoprotein